MADIHENARRLVQLFDLLRRGKHNPVHVRLSQLNLSFSHLRTLHLLAHDNTLAMKDLAEQLQMTPPSVTALTRRLIQTGLVQRESHPEDSRVALLSLTDEGRRFFEQIYQDQVRGMERLLHGLSPEEQQLFLSLLERAIYTMHTEQIGATHERPARDEED
ncbi:MAG TPA: MarR family transcriptional regulator [Herpetosiphonaceae bacterium]